MSTYKVIDNVLDPDALKAIQAIFLTDSFPWYYTTDLAYRSDRPLETKLSWYKFYHILYDKNRPASGFYEVICPILDYLKCESLVVCRAFLSTYTGEKLYQGFHTDTDFTDQTDWADAMKVAVFYVNTNNGGTLFENGDFVESVENRMVIFNIKQVHAGVTPDNTSNRVVLNFNYF